MHVGSSTELLGRRPPLGGQPAACSSGAHLDSYKKELHVLVFAWVLVGGLSETNKTHLKKIVKSQLVLSCSSFFNQYNTLNYSSR
jgi:hypothetical protein